MKYIHNAYTHNAEEMHIDKCRSLYNIAYFMFHLLILLSMHIMHQAQGKLISHCYLNEIHSGTNESKGSNGEH